MALYLLTLFHYALLLAYGIALSFAFAGIESNRKNVLSFAGLFTACGALQLCAMLAFDERFVWLAYPLLTHLPIVAFLCLRYRKRLLTALASVTTAYLCCQPANWAGILAQAITENPIAEEITQIIALALLGYSVLRYAGGSLASLYSKDRKSVLIFSGVPFVYYLFDYSMAIYSDHWHTLAGPVVEFIPCFLCLAFVTFCIAYHQTYEQKLESERREQIIRIMVEQQAHEVEAIRRGENEIRILRHDLRLLLNNLMQCLNEEDLPSAKKMLTGYLDDIDKTVIQRFCKNDIINYVVSDFYARCDRAKVCLNAVIELEKLQIDELLLASLLSNAFDNALNAQKGLGEDQRRIALSLKTVNDRLLFSLSNTYAERPELVDGMPVSHQDGHGYGTQSIHYMTERLGGSCLFSLEDNRFTLRVAIEL